MQPERACCGLLLNPSKASTSEDDPTIRKCVGFARQWGHGGIEVVNLYAFRATDPKDLARAGRPIGPTNDAHIRAAIDRAALIVCAWGAHEHRDSLRPPAIRKMLDAAGRHAVCLGRTASGQPKHPLYVPYETPCETYYTGTAP